MGRYVHMTPFLIIFLFFQLVCSQLPTNQISTMNNLYRIFMNTTGSSFTWNITRDPNPCSWRGVFCTPNNSSITTLSFVKFSLSNSDFLPILCQIDTLESLDLSINHLNSVPNEFINDCGQIRGLRLLNFSYNRLSGFVPSGNGSFVGLEYLDLSHNNLSGNIGLQLNGLVGLRSLNLSYNSFNGSIPTSLGRLTMLEELELSMNLFRGQIPDEIANCGNLSLINLSGNRLSGSIPDRFGELSRLEILVLSSNELSGEIPQSFLRLNTLVRFAANENSFSGNIPIGITRYLRNLDLSYNQLNGSIPLDLLTQSNLRQVDLSSNSLEGSIPANITPNLVRLRLGNNSLSGVIPFSSLGFLRNLTYLELDNNRLTGVIPRELGLCQNLALLNLAQNSLTGTLPVQLGNLSNLQVLMLQNNNLFGEIPIEITSLNRLLRLNMSGNSLNGSIPSSISRMQSLTNLDLQRNNLSGSIPNSIDSLNSLLELQLGRNQLSGAIRSLPLNLRIALNLSNNLFEGSIPSVLSRLTSLEVLDLSNNRFSGEIPNFFTRMGGLTQLVLSNNSLSGVIPRFASYVTVVTSGNRDLRNSSANNPPASRNSKNSVSVGVVIAAAASVVVVGLVATIALTVFRRFYRINDENLLAGEGSPLPQVLQGKFLTSNAIHRSNIVFSKAMESVSLSSNTLLKTRFSTYYKSVMPCGVSYLVKKLNWSDKIFQLGSHENFGEELEALTRLSNSSVMAPLAYVLTLDSAYIFYEFAEKGTLYDVLHGSLGETLDWSSRYSIAIGVAQGLTFLHGVSSGPILLLDLSSKGIMLKSLKEPQVGDIELCKVIDPSKGTGSLSTVAGSVGYIPPEYAYTMRVTMAGNVYSFGVVLLELVTGKRVVSEGTELAKWVLDKSAQQDKWDHILDFTISRSSLAIRSQMLAVLRVAIACVSVSPEARPKMKSVLRMLLNAR